MVKFASLPMYDFPDICKITDRFWGLINAELATRGLTAPKHLTRDAQAVQWLDKDMVFSQTCGLPFASVLAGRVQLVGTPDYGIKLARAGWYNSVIIARKNDPRDDITDMRGATFAFNSMGSQSGLIAMLDFLRDKFGDSRFLGNCIMSGSHENSAKMVVDGDADLAAIDAVSWRHITRKNNGTGVLRVLDTTRFAPGLPFITSLDQDADLIADAVEAAIEKLPDLDRKILGINGFWRSKPSDYALLALRAERVSGHKKMYGLSK